MSDDTMWSSVLHLGVTGTFLKAPHVRAEAAARGAAGATAACI